MVFQLDRAGGWLSGLCLCFPGRSCCASPVQLTLQFSQFPFSLCRMSFSLSVTSSGGDKAVPRGDSNTPEHRAFGTKLF